MSRAPTKRRLANLLHTGQRPIEVTVGQLLNIGGWLFVIAATAVYFGTNAA